MTKIVKVGCIKPDLVIELLHHQTVGGLSFSVYQKNGLQVLFQYEGNHEDLDGEDIRNLVKKHLKQDPVFDGIILTIEV